MVARGGPCTVPRHCSSAITKETRQRGLSAKRQSAARRLANGSDASFQGVPETATILERQLETGRIAHATLVAVRPADRSSPSVGQPPGSLLQLRRSAPRCPGAVFQGWTGEQRADRKSTRLNSS